MNLTSEQWRAEIERLEELSRKNAGEGASGFSSSDLAQHKGVGQANASAIIRRWIHGGLVQYSGKQLRPNITGAMQAIPVYVFTQDK